MKNTTNILSTPVAKKRPLPAVACSLVLMLTLVFSANAQKQPVEAPQKAVKSRAGTGEAISHRIIDLKEGKDPAAFEKWVVNYFNPALEGLIPGIRAYVAKHDRGAKKDNYAYVIHYDSYNTRQAFFPVPGQIVDWFDKVYYQPNKYLHDELFEWITRESWANYIDWVELR
jgi:hypothetical protein